VYVRDQYQLGTRQWLEGDNRAAFAQTLERMLDAVRLNYWQPDDATRKELVQAYTEALKATGLRESNPQVQRFAAQQMQANGASPSAAAHPAQAAPHPPRTASTSVAEQQSPSVRGLVLEPQAPSPPTTDTPPVVLSLAGMLGVALLLLVGAWHQTRRTRVAYSIPQPSLNP
jgi:cobaltochelatase CobN